MTDTKWLRHPNLPEGQEIEVRADAARHYYMSGWTDMEDPPEWATKRPEDDALAAMTPPSPETPDSESPPGDAPADSESGQTEDKPTRRARRTVKGDDQ